jgi:hypothetical protein
MAQFPTLHITIPKPAIDVAATGEFVRTKGAKGDVVFTPVTAVGIDIAIPLTDPKARQVFLGEVWVTGSSPLTARSLPTVTFAAAEEKQEPESSETMLRRLIAQLPPRKQRELQSLRPVTAMPQKTKTSARKAISIDEYAWRSEHPSSGLHLLPEPDVDLVHEQNDLLLWKSICAAYENKLPDERLRDACSSAALTIDER